MSVRNWPLVGWHFVESLPFKFCGQESSAPMHTWLSTNCTHQSWVAHGMFPDQSLLAEIFSSNESFKTAFCQHGAATVLSKSLNVWNEPSNSLFSLPLSHLLHIPCWEDPIYKSYPKPKLYDTTYHFNKARCGGQMSHLSIVSFGLRYNNIHQEMSRIECLAAPKVRTQVDVDGTELLAIE